MSEIHFRSHFWPFQIDRPFRISKIHFRSQFWPFQINTEFLFVFGGHFGCSKITLDRISGHFRSIGHFGYPKFTFNGISGYFRSIGNLIVFKFLTKLLPRPFWMSANNFRSHLWPFQIDTELFFLNLLTKWPPPANLDGTTMSIIKLVRDIWMINACVKFEERSLNPSKVITPTTK